MQLMRKSIGELAPLICAKEISPVELVRECLQRIEATDPTLNAYITVLADTAMEQANLAEQDIMNGRYKGYLHGIPYSVKDLFSTRGVRTTAGSKILADYVPEHDAAVVRRLSEAGAILVGKNNMHEFAFGGTNDNPHYGPTRNPYQPEMIPGGSSGGSAASVAASSSTFSIGSDTGGSVRMPAALCGVVGLKPTYGRISRHGMLPLSTSFDHVGPIAKTARDAAAVLNVLAGHDPKDMSSSAQDVPDYTVELDRAKQFPLRGTRIGICREYFFEHLHPQVEAAVLEAIMRLEELGARVVEVEVPMLSEIVYLRGLITRAEAYAFHAKYLSDRYQEYGSDVRERLEMGQYVPGWAYVQAQQLRQKNKDDWEEVYRRIDLLVAPTATIPAYPIGAEAIVWGEKDVNPKELGMRGDSMLGKTSPSNFNGYPAISVPCGFTSSGLPIGLQLQGRPFEEAFLLRAAHAYETAYTGDCRHHMVV